MVNSDVMQSTVWLWRRHWHPPTDQHVVKSEIIKCMCKRLKPGPFSSASLGLGTRLNLHGICDIYTNLPNVKLTFPSLPSAACWWIWSSPTIVYTVSHNKLFLNHCLFVCQHLCVFLLCNQLPHLLQAEVHHLTHHIPTAIYQVLNTVQIHPLIFLLMYITTIHLIKENLSVNSVVIQEKYTSCLPSSVLTCMHGDKILIDHDSSTPMLQYHAVSHYWCGLVLSHNVHT